MTIHNISNSLKISRTSKRNAYGHYCTLCLKYNVDRKSYIHFHPSMIMQVEYRQLNLRRQEIARRPHIPFNL